MIVYAESSAVTAWLLGEQHGDAVRAALDGAEHVVTSALTRVECHRGFRRAIAQRRLPEADAARLRAQLSRSSARWTVMALSTDVLERSAMAFPDEPVRSLDAIHLATALALRGEQPDVAVLSLDRRVRSNAEALGFEVLPA